MENIEKLKNELIGKTLKTVRHDFFERIRVMKEDGVNFFGTMDYDPNRINVEVKDGVIVRIFSLG